MSACQCYNVDDRLGCPEPRPAGRSNLFNWVTAVLVSMWVGIVAIAVEMAVPANLATVPTLEAFIRSLF